MVQKVVEQATARIRRLQRANRWMMTGLAVLAALTTVSIVVSLLVVDRLPDFGTYFLFLLVVALLYTLNRSRVEDLELVLALLGHAAHEPARDAGPRVPEDRFLIRDD